MEGLALNQVRTEDRFVSNEWISCLDSDDSFLGQAEPEGEIACRYE